MPNLSDLRSTYRVAKQTKAQIIASFKLISLGKYMDPFMDWLYGIALTLAIFKDLLDMTSLGILGLITTFFISFTIGTIMFITGSGMKKRIVQSIIKRYGTLFIGSLFEVLLGINILPGTTLMVVIVFYLTLRERMLADMEEKIATNEKAYPAAEPVYN